MAVKLSALTTESAPDSADILAIADPTTGVMKKITVSALKTYMDTLGGGSAPTVTSATCPDGAANTVVVVFNQSMTAVTTAGWSFKKNGSAWSVSSVTGATTTWTFTMGSSAAYGDTLLRSYDSTTGATIGTTLELVSFTDSSVTNSVAIGPSLEDITFPNIVGTVTNTAQVFTTNAGTGWSNNNGRSAKKLAAGQDGYIQLDFVATDSQISILGFNTTNTNPSDYAAIEAGLFIDLSGNIKKIDNGAVSSTLATASVGDWFRVNRTGSTLTIQKSTNDGVSWSSLATFTFSSTADLFINILLCGDYGSGYGKLYYPKGYNIS